MMTFLHFFPTKLCKNTGARDRARKNKLAYNKFAYNKFAYKKTKDDCKLEDRFRKNGQFSVAYTRKCR